MGTSTGLIARERNMIQEEEELFSDWMLDTHMRWELYMQDKNIEEGI